MLSIVRPAASKKDGKHAPGLRVSDNEGSKPWLKVLTGLKNWIAKDTFTAYVDGLTGIPRGVVLIVPSGIVHILGASDLRPVAGWLRGWR
jgi:putative transposase